MTDALGELVAYRLLTAGEDEHHRPTYEVSHEALIQNWARFREWLSADREFLLWRQRLRAALAGREHIERDEGALLRGAALTEAERWLIGRETDLAEDEQEFIRESVALREREREEHEERQRQKLEAAQQLAEAQQRETETQRQAASRLRRVLVGLAVVAIAALALAVFGMDASRRADANANDAGTQAAIANTQATAAYAAQETAVHNEGISQSIALAAQAQLEVAEQRSGNAILVALEALENYPYTSQAEQALGVAVQANEGIHVLAGHTGSVQSAAWSPDGARILTASFDNTARVWDAESGAELLTLAGHTSAVLSAAWSPDSAHILTASFDNTAKVWKAWLTKQDLIDCAWHCCAPRNELANSERLRLGLPTYTPSPTFTLTPTIDYTLTTTATPTATPTNTPTPTFTATP